MLRIMSNNQWRHDDNNEIWAARGENCSAEVREAGFVKVYLETLPDIIGLQEVSPKMLDLMMRGLRDAGMRYAAVWGRDTPILYRADKLELCDAEFGIYPASCPGYEGCFNNDDTKSWSVGVFRDKASRKNIMVTTTHLWWKSDDPANKSFQLGSGVARAYQIGLLGKRLDAFNEAYPGCPQVLMGDLNCDYRSEPIAFAKSIGFAHANDAARDYAYPYHGYHWCGDDGYVPYEPKPFEEAIDHILVRGNLTVLRFDRYIAESYLPLSDHFPAFIDAEIE